jgi:hypothetical protein
MFDKMKTLALAALAATGLATIAACGAGTTTLTPASAATGLPEGGTPFRATQRPPRSRRAPPPRRPQVSLRPQRPKSRAVLSPASRSRRGPKES